MKHGKTKQRDRYFNYLLIKMNDAILLEQRVGKGIWQGLYQFPLVETSRKASIHILSEALNSEAPSIMNLSRIAELPVHILSHQRIHAQFWRFDGQHVTDDVANMRWVRTQDVHELAVPRLIEKFLEEYPL